MSKEVTKDDIIAGLKNLGIMEGMTLEVHSSLSSFGYVAGGAETVIAALQAVVGSKGAIAMPAFKLSPRMPLTGRDIELGLTTKIKYLTDEREKSGMGIISDTFKQMPDVMVGNGNFRVAAWGKKAKRLSGGWSKVVGSDAYAVLLGVDIYRLSSMHTAEKYLAQKIKDMSNPSDEALRMYPTGEWLTEAWESPEKPWYKIQKMAFEQELITTVKIGECKCMFFPVKKVVELYKKALKEDAYGLYGVES